MTEIPKAALKEIRKQIYKDESGEAARERYLSFRQWYEKLEKDQPFIGLMGNNRTLGKFINFNWRWVQRMYGLMYKLLKKQSDEHLQDGSWNNTWGVEVNPEGRTEGVSVRLMGCPVYEFARKHGYENLMPELCRSDYKVFEPFHCRMIRYYTVANGDAYCDFWQVGDQSNAWKNADRSRLI